MPFTCLDPMGQDRIDMILSELPSNIPNPKHSHFHSMLRNLDSSKTSFLTLAPTPSCYYIYILYVYPTFWRKCIYIYYMYTHFCLLRSLNGSPRVSIVCWGLSLNNLCFAHLIGPSRLGHRFLVWWPRNARRLSDVSALKRCIFVLEFVGFQRFFKQVMWRSDSTLIWHMNFTTILMFWLKSLFCFTSYLELIWIAEEQCVFLVY